MSTRAVVKIEGINFAMLYKHYDGYPKSMLPFLEKFNRDFTENRGDDPGYKFAQLLRATKSMEEEFNLDSSDYTGYSIIPYGFYDFIEYEYELKIDGLVIVKSFD